MSGRGCEPMSRNKDCYPELTKKVKAIRQWIQDNDEYLERSKKYLEEYEIKRRQNDEANDERLVESGES